MTQDMRNLVTASCDLLALGEPTHREPAFARIRNELFAQLVDLGFRSIVLETDRVAALAVDDFVQGGAGTLDAVMSEGFSHGFGDLDANRRLVSWMREHNEGRPAEERLAFHGFDAPTENTSAPSPRRHLEYVRDYLGLDLDLAGLAGDDERWSRTEAVMDPAVSVGATVEAARLRSIADDMLTALYERAPEMIAATSRAEWLRARTHLTAGLGLLRYHGQAARHLEQSARMLRLLATRDALMAQNLLDIRSVEARRGATLVFAHNLHLKRNPSTWRMGDEDITWSGAGAIAGFLTDERYAFVAGSLGRSEALGLREPEPDTYEGLLQGRVPTWGLTPATAVASSRTRTDTTPEQGYFPLEQELLDTADAILHVSDGAATDGLSLGGPDGNRA
ncbi:erythromycin esterase [Nocardiopsis sp. TSRI0078]|uniref:erythromycin esterase family protein n=1 Tax=unclassified Nocardiopsis TaxID=2649073 RepID=UPI00093F4292|nr:erythromycin esterase family protein [Nocardiopsis sp. TSRI0078]OKI17028.1 erythromycin esterase [Nocardiopsis sp. TSRI0078]